MFLLWYAPYGGGRKGKRSSTSLLFADIQKLKPHPQDPKGHCNTCIKKKKIAEGHSLYQIISKIKQQKVGNSTLNITLMKHINLNMAYKGSAWSSLPNSQATFTSHRSSSSSSIVSGFFPLSSHCTCSLYLKTRSPYTTLIITYTFVSKY